MWFPVAAAALMAGLAVVVPTIALLRSRAARRGELGPKAPDDARALARPYAQRNLIHLNPGSANTAAAWGIFRGWAIAGGILLLVGAALIADPTLVVTGVTHATITLAVVASGGLAWVLGGFIAVTRAFDPAERRNPAELLEEPGEPEPPAQR